MESSSVFLKWLDRIEERERKFKIRGYQDSRTEDLKYTLRAFRFELGFGNISRDGILTKRGEDLQNKINMIEKELEYRDVIQQEKK